MATHLDYESALARSSRQPSGVLDWIYFFLVLACGTCAAIGADLMPTAQCWSFDFELAKFYMAMAAYTSLALLVMGLIDIVRLGRKRVPLVTLVATIAAGFLLLYLFTLGGSWMRLNFA